MIFTSLHYMLYDNIGHNIKNSNFYFVAENLVLWARLETIGYAVNLLQARAE